MSFGDNFKREAEEDMLEYDDSAFYYFSMSLLTCVTVPMTILMVKNILFGDITLVNAGDKNCETEAFKDLLAKKKKEVKRKMWTPNFYFKLLCLAFLWVLTLKNFEIVSKIETLQTFDPYDILGIDQNAKMSEIRRKYRRLSLEKHPDKNKENPLAV